MHVIVELKKFTGPNFDAEHTVGDLEAAFEEALGPWIYRPRDLLAACDPEGVDPDPDLTACLARTGWPTVAAMRGRFVFSVLGNFDDLIPEAKGTLDWVQFTLDGSLRERTSFSMASSWKLDWNTLPEKIQRELSRDDLARARRRAVFLQVEDVRDGNLPSLLAANGLARINGAFALDEQRERVALGAQILQSDTPWIQIEDRGPAQPLRSLDASADEIIEPGERFELAATDVEERFAWREISPSSSARWETLPSVSALSGAIPCLVATMHPAETMASSVAVCRWRVRADRTPGAPLGSGGPDAEKIRLRQRTCRDGQCEWLDLEPMEPNEEGVTAQAIEVGAAIALQLDPDRNGTCARSLAATDLDEDGAPRWTQLGAATCFSNPLAAQGLLTMAGEGGGSALFAGTRLWLDGEPSAVQPLTILD
jgi:hypothetical protein